MKELMSEDIISKIKYSIDIIDYDESDIHYIDKETIKENILITTEQFLIAQHKLEESGLMGTQQEYDSKLQTLLNSILKTSTFISSVVEFDIPFSSPVILLSFQTSIENILSWNILSSNSDIKTQVKYILDVVLSIENTKLRRATESYEIFLDYMYNDKTNYCSINQYVTRYYLLPLSKEFIKGRKLSQDELEFKNPYSLSEIE